MGLALWALGQTWAGQAGKSPVKVFILAGQSNMDGQASVATIDFLGEDKENGYLLKTFKPDGKTLVTRDDVWVAHRAVYPERDLKKDPITPEEQALLSRATSNLGYHYFGEGRFFILLGKSFAETMLELLAK